MTLFSSLLSFLSVVVIAWITQRIIAHREKRKNIDATKLGIYMGWMPYLAEYYTRALLPTVGGPADQQEFLKKKTEILGTLQIMGPDNAIVAFDDFCDMAEKGLRRDPSFDRQDLHEMFTHFNYLLCCEIHGEKERKHTT